MVTGMSGPEIAVGVLAAVATLGVVVLLLQVRSLRRDLAAAGGAAVDRSPAPADQVGSVQPPEPSPSTEPPGTSLVPTVAGVPAPGTSDRRVGLAGLGQPLGRPLVRAVALSYGVRRALAPANRDRIQALVRRDLRRRERLRRRAARRAGRVLPLAAAAPAPSEQVRDLAS